MIAHFTENLAYDPATRLERVAAVVLAVLSIGLAVAIAPFASRPLEPIVAAIPTIETTVTAAFALSAWTVFAQYGVRRYAPLAVLGCGFAAAATLHLATLLLYPGFFESDAWFGAGPQSGAWTFVAAQIAVAAVALGYLIAERRERRKLGGAQTMIRPAALLAAFGSVAGIVVATLGHRFLPELVTATGYTFLYRTLVAPALFAIDAGVAALIFALGTRSSRIPLWLAAVLVSSCGSWLAAPIFGNGPFTFGWYLARIEVLAEASVFVVVVQAQIGAIVRRAGRTAERAHALAEIVAIGDAQRFDDILAMIHRVASEFAFDSATLMRLCENDFVVEASFGVGVAQRGARIAQHDSIARLALAQRGVLVIDDLDAEPWNGERGIHERAFGSCCALAVHAGDATPYGVLAFANTRVRRHPFSSLECDFLSLAGILVGNGVARIEQRKRLDELAYYDALTGLPNRVLITERIASAIAKAERYGGRFALHFLDLDGFKPINDRHGHAVGDEVLREVGRRLAATVRTSDTVGRYGGDEFVVLQAVVEHVDNVTDLSARISVALATPIIGSAGTFRLSASVGVSIYPDDGTDVHTLVLRADEAQYRVKDARRAARRSEKVSPGGR